MKIKITEVDRFIWSILQCTVWVVFLMMAGAPSFNDVWSMIAWPLRLVWAWWFVSNYRNAQQHYQNWREEKMHEKIRPVITEPPTI